MDDPPAAVNCTKCTHQETRRKYRILGIVLAKKVFQLSRLNEVGEPAYTTRAGQKDLLQTLANIPVFSQGKLRRHPHPLPAVRGTFNPLRRLVRLPVSPLFAPLFARLCGGHGTTGGTLKLRSITLSRFISGDCVQLMSGFPNYSIDFILTDPLYLVGFKNRRGRSIANNVNDECGGCQRASRCSAF